MAKPSISMPDWMLTEVDRRNTTNDRSMWVKEAIQARMNAEDDGEWTTPEIDESVAEQADA